MRRWMLGVLAVGSIAACGDDDKKTDAKVDATDVSDADGSADATLDGSDDATLDGSDDAIPDADANADANGDGTADTETVSYTKPDYFPDKSDANEVLSFANLTGPVRVVYDNRGIPHIYGKNVADVSFVQGYVTARDRIFQMHTLRSAAKGRLAEFSGVSSLAGDVLLRTLKLGHTADKMAEYTQANDPGLAESMNSYTAGVNAFLVRMRAGVEQKPPEVTVFGVDTIYDWSNADTMAIVRLQTWDLGFGGIVDELNLWNTVTTLRQEFKDTKRARIELDVANFEPNAETATLEPAGGAHQVGTFDLDAVLDNPFYSGSAARSLARQTKIGFDAIKAIPHRMFSGPDLDGVAGSNNWVVSGAYTESGRPIVSNDTHLALRNPAIFYHVHLSTKLAGGDLNVQGVNFAGAPGAVLGHNDHIAWGATVFYSDVTDMYVEKLDATHDNVWFKGAWVPLTKRVEAFDFQKPDSAAKCIDAAPAYLKNLENSETLSGFHCHLEVTILDVPHHGPIIPWSFRKEGDQDLAVSWKWTGFEPTDELGAVYRLDTASNYDQFKAALDHFGVGAQNWIFGSTAGDIGWYPSHNLPIRKNIAAGDYTYPPFLPMPGDTGDNEWEGMLPRDQIPQAHDPAQGYIITSNADPIGVSFDNDPFNDGPYIGYTWAVGYRETEITRRIHALIERSSSKITPADMQSVQADHRSNLGADLAPVIVAAIDRAADSDDPAVAALVTPAVAAANEYLRRWADNDYLAHEGVGDGLTQAQIDSSVATSIFNAFLPFVLKNTVGDEGYLGLDVLGNSSTGRFLKRLFVKPETMASYDAINGVSPIWDDMTTADVVETREEIIAKSLAQTIAWARDPAKVGIAAGGGFGTDDMSAWRWGKIHTVKLKHNVAPTFDIPAVNVLPDGFPRGGDNFSVDAPNPGFYDTVFTYSSGAAIRNVYDMTDIVGFHGVIPGGQAENPLLPHYNDEAFLWAKNEAPEVAFTVEDVLAAREKTVDFVKP